MADKPTMDVFHGTTNTSTAYMPPEYIVVHYTAGSGNVAQDGTRLNLCQYFANAYRGASANYFIDNGGIAEYADPDESFTWHCGDGQGRYGIYNGNSVGIEVCAPDYSEEPYTEAEIGHLRDLVLWLMERYGIDKEHVVRHYDASRKSCPWYYTPSGNGGDEAWYDLRDYITAGTKEEIKEDDDMAYVDNEIYRHIIESDYYPALLHRSADFGGTMVHLRTAISDGLLAAANSIISSDEWQDMNLSGIERVKDFYLAFLGRTATNDEAQGWLDTHGTDLYSIAEDIYNSDEAAAHRASLGL